MYILTKPREKVFTRYHYGTIRGDNSKEETKNEDDEDEEEDDEDEEDDDLFEETVL